MHVSQRYRDCRNKLGRKPSHSTGVNKKAIKTATSLTGRNHIRQQITEQQLVAQIGIWVVLAYKRVMLYFHCLFMLIFGSGMPQGKTCLMGHLMLDQMNLSYCLQLLSSLNCYCCLTSVVLSYCTELLSTLSSLFFSDIPPVCQYFYGNLVFRQKAAVEGRPVPALLLESSGYPSPKRHWIFIPSYCIRVMGVKLCLLLPSIFQHQSTPVFFLTQRIFMMKLMVILLTVLQNYILKCG